MLMAVIVVLVVSGALLLGAAWGLFGRISGPVEGFVVALAGGALIVSLMEELVRPAIDQTGLLPALLGLGLGAGIFTVTDWLIDEKWENSDGGGLLASVTLDGIPENLALGAALLGAGPLGIASLAGSILLSNLPEAAGGAKRMHAGGQSKATVFWIWAGAAGLLSGAAILGYVALENAPARMLSIIKTFAAGAMVASLATEVFPKSFQEDRQLAGLATAIGLGLAAVLSELG